MLIDTLHLLIEESEYLYLGKTRPKYKLFGFLQRHFLCSILLIRKGMVFALKECVIYCIIYLSIVITVTKISLDLPNEIKEITSPFFIYFVIIAPIFLVLFLPPSAFVDRGINKDIITSLSAKIDCTNLEGLIEVLHIYESNAIKRITFIKRLNGIIWGVIFYFFEFSKNNYLELISLSQRNINSIAMLIFTLVFSLVCTQAYSHSVMAIINNIKVALIEKKRA